MCKANLKKLLMGAILCSNLVLIAEGTSQVIEFNPNLIGPVKNIAIQDDGKIIVAGIFGVPGKTQRLVRLHTDGSLDKAFDPQPNDKVESIEILANGQILIGGQFTTVGGVNGFLRNRFAQLNADGTVDATFNPNVNGRVKAIAVQSDGKILIGGSFTTVSGVARNRIARLNVDGSLDFGFDPDVDNNDVKVIAIQSDDDILIGGNFTGVGGVARQRLARLDPSGMVDPNFSPDVDRSVNSIAIQADTKILIGGEFTGVGQYVRNRLARLEFDGGLDIAYNPAPNRAVSKLVLLDDGKLLVAGDFRQFDTDPIVRERVARLNSDGSVDGEFVDVQLNRIAFSVAVQADGKILVGGEFSEVGFTARNGIARFESDGRLEQLIPDLCLPIIAANSSVAFVCL